MSKQRLDKLLSIRGIVRTRSQAGSYIRLGRVEVDGRIVKKAGTLVDEKSAVKLTADHQYVSRAGLKLASVAEVLKLDFAGKSVLDVGSSTGGFTHYALVHGAKKIVAVDIGTNQLHPSLKTEPRIELHEQTDIRSLNKLNTKIDIVLIDVSFISLREILPHIAELISADTQVVAMLKPQFEASGSHQKHKGVIKNNALRRQIMKDFELWVTSRYKIVSKADSSVSGEKGNQERFYLLRFLS